MRTLLLAAALLLPQAALAAGGGITVEGAYARATAGADMPGVIFATIHGAGANDRLVGIATPVAARAALHVMDMAGSTMRMRMVSSLPVPAGGTLSLDPAGDHVMLTGMTEALAAGTTFPATFRFAHAAPVTVTVHVGGPAAAAPP